MDYSNQKLNIAKDLYTTISKIPANKLQAFIVYGSVATNKAKKESDLDIMILIDYPDMNFLQQVKSICNHTQVAKQEQIALSFNTVSKFITEMSEGHQMYINIVLKGQCLMQNSVFDGLKKMLNANKLPPKEDILAHRKSKIQTLTQHFLGRSMTDFIADIDAIVRTYLHFKEYKSNSVSTWESYEALIDHTDVSALTKRHLPQYSEVLDSFYTSKHVFSPVYSPKLDNMQSLELTKLLQCVQHIQSKMS